MQKGESRGREDIGIEEIMNEGNEDNEENEDQKRIFTLKVMEGNFPH